MPPTSAATPSRTAALRTAAARRQLPLLVLAVSLTLTLLASVIIGVTTSARDAARFENAVSLTRTRIDSRLRTYVTMLRGTKGLFVASGEVTPVEFRDFVAQFDIPRQYPGIHGVGFARRVPAGELEEFLARWRSLAGAEVGVLDPGPPRDEYFPIVLLEPLSERNRRAVGFDMFVEPVRRAAMAEARDRGEPVISGRVILRQDSDEAQPGFLLYFPVYDGGGIPATLEARRERLMGFVYAPFRAGSLFAEIDSAGRSPVAFRVYDGRREAASLLYDPVAADAAPEFRRTDTLTVFGRTWTLAFESRPVVEERAAGLLAPAIFLAGTLVSVLLFVVTRREVRAGEAVARSEQARSRFYAAMSHELRTPLNAIMGYNDLLLAGVFGPLAPEQERSLERGQTAARHLLDIVNDVLDLSKLEAGKTELVEEVVRVPALVDEIFATMRGVAEASGSTLELECPHEVDTIITDPRRVRQILLNLLSNAIKFGEGRPIRVRCAPARDGGVCIEVTDQGVGVAREDQERIFEEFVQLPAGEGRGGTGLGLPISRRLSRLLGGRLTVHSEPGAGSTFRVELPARVPGR